MHLKFRKWLTESARETTPEELKAEAVKVAGMVKVAIEGEDHDLLPDLLERLGPLVAELVPEEPDLADDGSGIGPENKKQAERAHQLLRVLLERLGLLVAELVPEEPDLADDGSGIGPEIQESSRMRFRT